MVQTQLVRFFERPSRTSSATFLALSMLAMTSLSLGRHKQNTTQLSTQSASNSQMSISHSMRRSVNLTLNEKKCKFNKPSLTFFGFVFSGDGIAPDPKKVEAIKDAYNSHRDLLFLGMATYCAKFIPNFSNVSAPLRELTKKDKPFHWSAPKKQYFKKVKELLTSAKVMAYFDPKKQTELTTDASPTGLSATWVQKSPASDDK